MILPRRAVAAHEVADHYDDLDRFYREVWGEHVHHGLWHSGRESTHEAVRQLVRHLAACLDIRRGMRVVDVGSGYGATARQLAVEDGAEVTAITLSPAQHAFASRTLGRDRLEGVRYVLGDWTANSFPAGSFERAIAIESTEHMADKPRAFGELARVLAPRGRLGICAWIAADRPADWMVRRLLEPICREGRLPGMGTERDYQELLEGSGLVVEKIEDLTAAVAATWSHSVRRVAARIAADHRYRQYILNRGSRNREFALTLVRILVAYRVRAMRYLLFVARKPIGRAAGLAARDA